MKIGINKLRELRYIEGENFKMTPVYSGMIPLVRHYPARTPIPRDTNYCECHDTYHDCGYQDWCR